MANHTHVHEHTGAQGHDGHGGEQDKPLGHGMVVFGRDSVFMSHLMMFSMRGHDYQVILETELSGDTEQVYRKDREQHPESDFYTFQPKPFLLPAILPLPGKPPTATSFTGLLHRNHFEQGDTEPEMIASDVTVTVSNVVHGRRFDSHPGDRFELQYVLFGRGDEVFLAHLVTRPPDFDHIIQVTITPAPSPEELSSGLLVTLDGRANLEGARLQSTDSSPVSGSLHTATGTVPVSIVPGAKIYFNANSDLTDPPPDA